MENLTIFETKFNNPELEQEFNNFFTKYNLLSLFTNEHRASQITVTYVDAKSLINKGGSYNKTFKAFTDYLNMAQDNKKYEEAIFKIIYNARTFQGLANQIKRLMQYIDSDIDDNHKFNTWNIVWYTKEVF